MNVARPVPKRWPDIWTTDMIVTNEDNRVWTVVPYMVTAELRGKKGDFRGIRPKPALDEHFDAHVFEKACWAPSGASGTQIHEFSVFDLNSSALLIKWATAASNVKASWKHNGSEKVWKPTILSVAERISSEWEDVDKDWGIYIEPADRNADEYRLVQLGPLFLRNDKAGCPFAMVADLKKTAEPNTWATNQASFVPLTKASVKKEITDQTKPFKWHAIFLLYLWDHPAPVPAVDHFLVDVMNDSTAYSGGVRGAAALSLLDRNYPTARSELLSIVTSPKCDGDLRIEVMSRLSNWGDAGIDAISIIAKDRAAEKRVREYALSQLSQTKGKGWTVIAGLTGDAEVGEEARNLLKERDKDSAKKDE